MKCDNQHLHKAKAVKNDEFFTSYSDVQAELDAYAYHFADKVIYCNCDNPYQSNFFRYFVRNFNKFHLRKLVTTNYIPFLDNVFKDNALSIFKPFHVEISVVPSDIKEDFSVDALCNIVGNDIRVLKGDGDFRSVECVEILNEADIVITNPPFSLLREYFTLMTKYNKHHITLGNLQLCLRHEVLPHIIEGRIWVGNHNGSMKFLQPTKDDPNHVTQMGNVCWFSTLHIPDFDKKHLELTDCYEEGKYLLYINYEAIDVSTLDKIPQDYVGVMAVPVTFFKYYNPKEFQIIGTSDYAEGKYGAIDIGVGRVGTEWITRYRALGGCSHYSANMYYTVYYDRQGRPAKPFSRLLVRNRKPTPVVRF